MENFFSGENPQQCSTWWFKLPSDFQEDVLASLPPSSLQIYRGVCKEWNVFLSSTKFKRPWLVMCYDRRSLRCMAYCFSTNTWKAFSLAFLVENYRLKDSWINGSAVGLFLVTISQLGYPESFLTVCNPQTGTSIKLLTINDISIKAIGIMGGEDQGQTGGTYKVIMVAESGNEQRVEIYDSSLKWWGTVGHLPHNLKAIGKMRKRGTLISKGFLYCLGIDINNQRQGIVVFSVQNGTSMFWPLPLEEVADDYRREYLFTCDSRVFLASAISDADRKFRDIIIWEFEKPQMASNYSSGFKDITRMPPFGIEDFRRKDYDHLMFDLEGVLDTVCIKYQWADEVLAYNLCENKWRWLPRCPLTNGIEELLANGSIYAFDPNVPEMKVE